MMKHFHWLDLKCDIEIAFPGWQIGKKNIKHKNTLYRISLKHPTSYDISKYKDYKNKLLSILKKEEKNYYRSEIHSNKNNLRKVWDIIKQVVNRKKGSKIHEKFIHNDKEIADPKAIADGFNNYFVNIGPTLASKYLTAFFHTEDFFLKTWIFHYSWKQQMKWRLRILLFY